MRARFFPLLVFLLSLVGISPVLAQPIEPEGERQVVPRQPPALQPLPGERQEEREFAPRFRRRPQRRMDPQMREQRRLQVRRAKEMAQRLLENPHTPAEVKAKAGQLTELLNKREGLERDLDTKRQDFLKEHGQDLDELRQLREQGERVRQRLRAARQKVISENLPAIEEMRKTTQEARNLASELRHYYGQQRGRGRPAPQQRGEGQLVIPPPSEK